MTNVRLSLLIAALLLPLVLIGCDATGGDTIVLNTTEDDAQLDSIEYSFRYRPDEVNDGTVEVVSEKEDDPGVADTIDDLLSRNGFSRADIVSAKVVEAILIRRSDPSSSSLPKVFQYLDQGKIEAFLGDNFSGKPFAEKEIQSTDKKIPLDILNGGDVTTEMKSGTERVSLRLSVTSNVSQEDAVDVRLAYQIEVRGV
jgi:hypothetical protein